MYIILYCLGSTIMSLLMAFNMNISLSDETLWSLEEVELVSIDTHKVFRKKKNHNCFFISTAISEVR